MKTFAKLILLILAPLILVSSQVQLFPPLTLGGRGRRIEESFNSSPLVVKAASPTSPVRKSVLLLFPYQFDLPYSTLALQAIKEEFNHAADLSLDLYYEYLDLNRFPDEAYRQQLLSLYITKYRHKPIDLVIIANEVMLDLWLAHRGEILPNTPVVFYDIITQHLAGRQFPPDVTGVSAVEDYTKSIRWLLQARPSVKEIVIVHGVGKADQEFIQPVDEIEEALRGQVMLTDLSDLSLPEIKQRVAVLPESSVVLYHLMFEDAAGIKYRPIDALRELTEVSAVPVISGYDQFIGTGTIGGYMYSIEQQAGQAARIGLRILRGEPVSAIPPITNQGNRFIFDHPALQRWNIPLSALPPESIIKNRQVSLWEGYRLQIIAIGAIFTGLTLLVGFLVGLTRRLNTARLALSRLNASLETQVRDRTVALSQTNHRLEVEIAERIQAEHVVREKSEEIGRFFDCALDLLCIADTDGYFYRLNLEWEKVLGYSLAELQRHRFLDFVHPDDMADTLAAVGKLETQHEVLNFINRYRCRDNSYRWIEWRSFPYGKLIYAAARDITERKRTEEALCASEARYRLLADNSPLAVNVVDLETARVLYINPMSAVLFETTVAQALDANALDYYVDRRDRDRLLQKLSTQGFVNDFEVRLRRKSGQEFWASVTATLSIFEDRQVTHSVYLDITERKRTEAALKESEREKSELLEKLNEAQQIAMIGSWEWNLQTNQVWWSAEIYRIFGAPLDFVPSFAENGKFIYPDDLPIYEKAFEHSLKTGKPFDIDLRLVTNDGRLKYCNAKGKIIYNNSGQPIRFVGIMLDITERKQAEAVREMLIAELQEVLTKVHQLEGILPICSFCKRIRDQDGQWQVMEAYISHHSQAEFSHGFCPECGRKYYPEYYTGPVEE